MGLDPDAMKRTVEALLTAAFTRGPTVEAKRLALAECIDPAKYIQHSAGVADGFDGLMDLIGRFDALYDDYSVEVKRMAADGQFVWAHCHYRFGSALPRGRAIVEIFRFENGRAVEHWDVIQDVPETMPHHNGLF